MASVIVSSLGLTGIAASIATALISFAISYISQSLFAPDAPETPPDQGVSARIPTDPKNKLPVVYGEQRVSGQSIFADISSDNQTMYFIIALCEGPVEAIDEVTWENKVLTFDGDISTGLRNVTSANSTNPNDETEKDFLNGLFRCRTFNNGGNAVDLTASKSPRWNENRSNRLMPNTAYAYVELEYDREKRVTGLPSKLYFNVKGRTVITLDTADNSLDTSTTMSSNPVDNLIDYMTNSRYGCGLTEGDLDLPSFNAHKLFCNNQLPFQQNHCVFPTNSFTTNGGDTQVNPDDYRTQVDCLQSSFFVGSTAGSRTPTTGASWELISTNPVEPRYTTNGVLNTNSELDRNLSDLTVGNGGVITYNLGKFGILSEGFQNVATRGGANVSFSEDNIIGKIDITGSGFDAVLNEVTAKFTSDRQNYQQEQVRVSFENYTGTDAVGTEVTTTNLIQNPAEPRLEKTLQLPFTNNDVEARRIARVIVNDSRQALIVNFKANIDNTDLQAGDIIEISHETPDWNNKLFRIQQVDEQVIDQDNYSIGVSIIAREYSAEAYNAETLLLQDPAPNTNLPNPLVVVDLGLTAEDENATDSSITASEVINGVPTSQILVAWNNSTFLDTVEVRYAPGTTQPADNSNTWTSVTFDGENENGILTNLEPETTYQIQARARNTLGSLGPFAPSNALEVTTVPLDSLAPLDVEITSTGGTIFKNTAGSKEITATVFISGSARPDTTEGGVKGHETFNYQWAKDGVVMCLDGDTNDILPDVSSIDLSIGGSGTFTEAQCKSAGGTFTAGTPNTCTVGGNAISSNLLGCTTGNRADSENTGSSLKTNGGLRTLTLGAEDFTNSAGISCRVSNID